MDIIDQIKNLAGGAADLTLQKMKTERIGAEAERRGLFEGYLRSVPSPTFADLLRERQVLLSLLTEGELKFEFSRRGLNDEASYSAGKINATDNAYVLRDDEAARVRALAAEIVERAEKL